MCRISILLIIVLAVTGAVAAEPPATSTAPAGSKVTFNSAGIAQVDGKPFFPVGIFTYELNTNVMADLHEQRFNTILNGFKPEQLDYIHQHGLMAVCFTDEAWLKAARNHPALLAWYLTDEPEGHEKTPQSERDRYQKLKAFDPDHPIGLCHFLFEALGKYKDASDFTMTDVYPVTAHRDVPLANVGIHIDEARRVHGEGWPNWAYIQDFGGPETDGGKWAQPLPHEVRCMAYIALVHRATGILYFSYWPKAPATWNSIGQLNSEIHRLVPRLVAPGEELSAKSSRPQVQIRAKRINGSGLVIAVNTQPTFVEADLEIIAPPIGGLDLPFEGRTVKIVAGRWRDRFGPYEEHVYRWGAEPSVRLARQ